MSSASGLGLVGSGVFQEDVGIGVEYSAGKFMRACLILEVLGGGVGVNFWEYGTRGWR